MTENKSYDDDELLYHLAEGDSKALEYTYTQYFAQLSYYAYKLTGNAEQAKDIASDVLTRTAGRGRQFKSLVHLKNYLFLVTRHASLDFLGQQQKEQYTHEELQYLAGQADEPSDLEQLRTIVIAAVYEQVKVLPKGCAEVFKLAYFEGKSTEEIAGLLNISTKTVLNQRQNAAKLLKTALLKKGLLTLFIALFGEF